MQTGKPLWVYRTSEAIQLTEENPNHDDSGRFASGSGGDASPPKITNNKAPKHPRGMTASEINKELDKLDKHQSDLTDRFIAAGRGYEKPSEISKKTDPLSIEHQELSKRYADLRDEMTRRYGADAPPRLPKGFK